MVLNLKWEQDKIFSTSVAVYPLIQAALVSVVAVVAVAAAVVVQVSEWLIKFNSL